MFDVGSSEWFDDVVVHAGGQALLAVADQSVGGDTDTQLQDIIVTGTRLGEVSGFTSPTPVTVLSPDYMQKLAITNVADAPTACAAARSASSCRNFRATGLATHQRVTAVGHRPSSATRLEPNIQPKSRVIATI